MDEGLEVEDNGAPATAAVADDDDTPDMGRISRMDSSDKPNDVNA